MPVTIDQAGIWDHRESRLFWFAELERAISSGDFDLAAEAGRQLRRLGVAVSYPPKKL